MRPRKAVEQLGGRPRIRRGRWRRGEDRVEAEGAALGPIEPRPVAAIRTTRARERTRLMPDIIERTLPNTVKMNHHAEVGGAGRGRHAPAGRPYHVPRWPGLARRTSRWPAARRAPDA